MKQIIPIMKREFSGYFSSPVAYVFIIIFLISTTGATWYLGSFYKTNEASLDIFFFFHPWLYLFLIPSVGMRLWAEERRTGTIELLFTLPVYVAEAVVGKFLAGWLFIGVALLLTFPMVFTVYYLGNPDGGVILTGYIGSFLMAGAYLSITSFTSALTKNQVISFVLGFLVCLIFVLLGWGVLGQTLVDIFPVWIADLITNFSFTTHFNSLKRGIIDFRDVVYFLSIMGFMLGVNIMALEAKRSA